MTFGTSPLRLRARSLSGSSCGSRAACADTTAGVSSSRTSGQRQALACGSKSMRTVACPACSAETARLIETVVLPAPPFADKTAIFVSRVFVVRKAFDKGFSFNNVSLRLSDIDVVDIYVIGARGNGLCADSLKCISAEVHKYIVGILGIKTALFGGGYKKSAELQNHLRADLPMTKISTRTLAINNVDCGLRRGIIITNPSNRTPCEQRKIDIAAFL